MFAYKVNCGDTWFFSKSYDFQRQLELLIITNHEVFGDWATLICMSNANMFLLIKHIFKKLKIWKKLIMHCVPLLML